MTNRNLHLRTVFCVLCLLKWLPLAINRWIDRRLRTISLAYGNFPEIESLYCLSPQPLHLVVCSFIGASECLFSGLEEFQTQSENSNESETRPETLPFIQDLQYAVE